jgi:hypothetical protein
MCRFRGAATAILLCTSVDAVQWNDPALLDQNLNRFFGFPSVIN